MANASDYSQTPSSNTSLFPEDMAPSQVNNSARQVQADIAGYLKVYTAGGTSNAQTVTLDPAPSAYSDKMRFAFKPAARNTGSATINVNSLGAKTIKMPNGDDLRYGALTTTQTALVQYDGTNFILLNPAVDLNIVSVTDFGAVGDNVADDTTKIQAAADYAETLADAGKTVTIWFPPALGYRTTAQVTFKRNIGVIMDAPIIYDGGLNVTALLIGEQASAGFTRNQRYVIDVKRSSASDWTNEASIGVKFVGINTSDIYIRRVDGFTIGAKCKGESNGFVYNIVRLGQIVDNKYGLDLDSENIGSGVGWCNENLWLGGEFATRSTTNTAVARYGVRITSQSAHYSNANTFIKPSFEMGSSWATAEAVPILVEYGTNNRFLECRNEGNDTPFSRESNSSYENEYTVAYTSGTGKITIERPAGSNSITNTPRRPHLAHMGREVFNSGPLHKKACYYDGSTAVNIPGIHIAASSGATAFNSASGITIASDYIETNQRGFGVFVHTENCKRFSVKKDVESGFGGRVKIRCYDSAGTVLDNLGGGHPYVVGTAFDTFSYSADFGKVYTTGADSDDEIFFEVGTDVAYVAVIVAVGSANLRIRNFQINAVDGEMVAPAAWAGYEEVVPGANIGTAAPTAGTWERGRRVYNSSPSASGTEGWICVTAGSPGTWKTFGTISA